MCGEACPWGVVVPTPTGPSPRVRGSRHDVRAGPVDRGSIPACAGKPEPALRRAALDRVHPRVCGEASTMACRALSAAGPSPRVRGSQEWGLGVQRRVGSIPACAGKPGRATSPPFPSGVHPRVCGEAGFRTGPGSPSWGPSPRVRGSPGSAGVPSPVSGSIPACAGKPFRCRRGTARSGVHPRVCGEANYERFLDQWVRGPSPRVRGSPVVPSWGASRARSIPACAGKPR